MASEATGRESDKFMLRLPDGMRERLKAAAETNKRSMNAEIVARLAVSLDADARRNYEYDFDEVVAAAAKQAASAAATQAIDAVLRGLSAAEESTGRPQDPGAVIRRANEREACQAPTPDDFNEASKRLDERLAGADPVAPVPNARRSRRD